MILDEGLHRRSNDVLDHVEHDISIIRRDLIAVLQETASLRASMKEFSSWRPGVTKRFVVLLGVLCFLVVATVVFYQVELQSLVHWIGPKMFIAHS